MPGTLATRIEAARSRVFYLEFALIGYAGYPAAVARIEAQLDAARRELAELQAGGISSRPAYSPSASGTTGAQSSSMSAGAAGSATTTVA